MVSDITNYLKLSGLKQHKFVIIEFWRSEVRFRSHKANMARCQQSCILKALRKRQFPAPWTYWQISVLCDYRAKCSIFFLVVNWGPAPTSRRLSREMKCQFILSCVNFNTLKTSWPLASTDHLSTYTRYCWHWPWVRRVASHTKSYMLCLLPSFLHLQRQKGKSFSNCITLTSSCALLFHF